MQYGARADRQLTDQQTAALAPPSFTAIVDNGWDRWFMLVLPGDQPDRRRCRQVGVDAAFAELSGSPRALIVAEDQDVFRQQAEDAQQHYERTGDVSSLDLALNLWGEIYTELEDPAAARRVITALKEGIRHAPADSTIQFARIAALGYASLCLFTLTRETGELENLPAVGRSIPAIERRLRALESSGADDPVLRELYGSLKQLQDSLDQMRGT